MSPSESLWSSSSAALLRQYLETDAGQVFLAHLSSHRPGLLVGSGDVNSVALKAMEVAGFEKCFNTILLAAQPPQEEQKSQESFPELEDDSKWPAHLQDTSPTPKES